MDRIDKNISIMILVIVIVVIAILIYIIIRMTKSMLHYSRALAMLEIHLLKRMSDEELDEYQNDQMMNRKDLWASIGWTIPVFSRQIPEKSKSDRHGRSDSWSSDN